MLTNRCCNELTPSVDETGTREIRSPASLALPQPAATGADRTTKKRYERFLTQLIVNSCGSSYGRCLS